jgi:hypothetical protein
METNKQQTVVSTPDLGSMGIFVDKYMDMYIGIEGTKTKTQREIAQAWHPVFSILRDDWYMYTSKNKPKDDKGIKEIMKREQQFVSGLELGKFDPATKKLIKVKGSTARTALQRIREYAMQEHKPEAFAALVAEREAASVAMFGKREKKDFTQRCEDDISPVIRMGDALADSDLQAKEIALLKSLKAAFKAAGINWVKVS